MEKKTNNPQIKKVNLNSEQSEYKNSYVTEVMPNTWEDCSDAEKVLRKFDLQLQFGPCSGISRTERWQRAKDFGLNPPEEVLFILNNYSNVSSESIFENPARRVIQAMQATEKQK